MIKVGNIKYSEWQSTSVFCSLVNQKNGGKRSRRSQTISKQADDIALYSTLVEDLDTLSYIFCIFIEQEYCQHTIY